MAYMAYIPHWDQPHVTLVTLVTLERFEQSNSLSTSL